MSDQLRNLPLIIVLMELKNFINQIMKGFFFTAKTFGGNSRFTIWKNIIFLIGIDFYHFQLDLNFLIRKSWKKNLFYHSPIEKGEE